MIYILDTVDEINEHTHREQARSRLSEKCTLNEV